MTFKKGDFIRIREGVHDAAMPISRMGHLIDNIEAVKHYTSTMPEPTNVWFVLMTNGNRLRFHERCFEMIDENG